LKTTDIPEKSTIILIVAVSHRALEERAEQKTKQILNSYKDCFNIKQFSASTLKKINSEDQNLAQFLNLYGYSNVRNTGLAIAQILKSDILVFLDDDVVVNDQRYFHKAQEYVGKNIDGSLLGGIAGYYINNDDSYYLNVNPKVWWKTFWPKEKKMNKAFKVIESKQRLVETTFAFGGNMVLHWKMFQNIPFDPYITRGEDMDLLVNAKMFSFKFKLDTKLGVRHLPGEKKSLWSEMRQDLYRFLYMRKKMQVQRHIRDSKYVSIESLKPYPGYFLSRGTSFKFAASSCLNSIHSIFRENLENFKESTCNIMQIPSALSFAIKHCLDYFEFQKKWASYILKIRNDRGLANILNNST
jgi:hypothetical protein